MPDFNPSIQDVQPPEFLRYFKPIETPEVDKSKAIAIKGVGDIAEQAISSADEVEKIHAEHLGRDLGEQETTNFLGSTLDSLISRTDNTPDSVKSGLASIGNLQSGKEHMSELEYRKNLYVKAKQLRDTNPGYRDYIDKGVAKVTGINPTANEYITSLLSDLNRNLEQTNKGKEKSLNEAYTELGAPGMADNIASYKRGEHDANWLDQRTAESKSIKWNAEVKAAQFKGFEGDRATAQAKAVDLINDYATNYTSQTLNGTIVSMGLTEGKLKDFVDKQARGEDLGFSDDQWKSALVYLESQTRAMQSHFDSKFTSLVGPDGRNVKVTAAEKYDSTIKQGQAQIEGYKEAIKNHDIGFMYAQKNAVEAMKNGDAYRIYQDKDVGAQIRFLSAVRSTMGDQTTAALVGIMGADFRNKITDETSVKNLIGSMVVPGGFKGIDNISKAYGAASNEGNAADRNVVATAPTQVIPNPEVSDPAKLQALKYTFNPSSDDLMGKIAADGKTLDGKDIRGRHAVFSDYAKPAMVAEVNRLSSQYGSQYKDSYVKTMETWFAKDLFGRDVNELATMQKEPGVVLKWHDDGHIPYFEIARGKNGNLQNMQRPDIELPRLNYQDIDPVRFQNMQRAINRLNGGIASMSNVYANTGEQMSGKILTLLSNSGVDMSKSNVNIPYNLLTAVGMSMKKPEPPKETK